MYSIPQQAVTNGYWKIEYFLAHPMASSSLPVKKLPTPIRGPLAPDVRESEHQDAEEHEHLDEAEPAELPVERRPRPDEQQLDVDDDEEDRDRGELDGKAPLRDRDRILAALEGLGLHRREPARCDQRRDEQERAGHQRAEREHHEDRRVGHCSGCREAAFFRGWPDTDSCRLRHVRSTRRTARLRHARSTRGATRLGTSGISVSGPVRRTLGLALGVIG